MLGHLGIIAPSTELQHLVKILTPREQPAEAPEGSSSKIAATDALKLAVPTDHQHADPGTNVDQQIRVEGIICVGQGDLQAKLINPDASILDYQSLRTQVCASSCLMQTRSGAYLTEVRCDFLVLGFRYCAR